jgi:hypothetical protein
VSRCNGTNIMKMSQVYSIFSPGVINLECGLTGVDTSKPKPGEARQQ